ncbi:MAG: trimeric intracellular cation channel family protein [Planctomycetaceae bacterium]
MGTSVLFYYFDLAGVAIFAASGVLAARDRDLDLLGIMVVATLTAIGGGTVRDLLLDRHPIFWVADSMYLVVIIAAAILTVGYLRVFPPPGNAFQVADALGLSLFAMNGAKLALATQHPLMIVVVMGAMTGVAGGILRDVITARVPLILQRELYATAAVAGIAVYLTLQSLAVRHVFAFSAGMLVVVSLRLLAIRWGLNLPVLRRAEKATETAEP